MEDPMDSKEFQAAVFAILDRRVAVEHTFDDMAEVQKAQAENIADATKSVARASESIARANESIARAMKRVARASESIARANESVTRTNERVARVVESVERALISSQEFVKQIRQGQEESRAQQADVRRLVLALGSGDSDGSGGSD